MEKLGAKHATFGKAWKKAWRAPLFRHRWLPPTSGLRSSGIVIARRGCEATQEADRPAKGGVSMEKRQARFIQGDRPEAGPEPANDGSGELWIFLPKNRIVC